MTDEEFQAKLDAAVEAAVTKSNEDIAKLKAKNAELLNEKRTAKTAAEEAEARADEASEAAARAANDTAALEKSLNTKYQKQIETEKSRADAASATLQKLLVDNGITSALTAANVAPTYAKAAAALLKSENSIEIVDGAAMVNGTPLADFVAGWTKADGAGFVAAQQNSGGGSTGNTNTTGAGANAWTAENFAKRQTEFMGLVKTDKQAAVRAAQAAGQPPAVIDAISAA